MENSSEKKPSSLGDYLDDSQDEITVKEIISVYSSHSSIQKIKSVFSTDSKFDQPKPTASYINKIIKSLDTSKATGPYGIHSKFVQMSTNVIVVIYPISLPVTYQEINIPSMLKQLR